MHNLPTDIVRIIARFILVDDDQTNFVCAIPLLAVNHRWRAVAAEFFYTTAYFIEGSQMHNNICFSSNSVPAQTNIGLILQNGFENSIKRFVFIPFNNDLAKEIIDHIADCTELRLNDINPSICDEVKLARSAGSMLASRLPNIRYGYFDARNATDMLCHFIASIVDSYANRLVGLKYEGELKLPTQAPLTSLVGVKLHFFNAFSVDSFPKINPQVIRDLEIWVDCGPFDWGIFVGSENEVTFSNLETLSLSSFIYEADAPSIDQTCKLTFPSLISLEIDRFFFGIDDIQQQIQMGLRKLSYTGSFNDAISISQLRLNKLEELRLSFEFNDSDDEFTASSNKLFASLNGLKTLSCDVYSETILFIPSTIHWPHLTCLAIHLDTKFEYVLRSVLNMPNLTTLKFVPLQLENGYMEEACEYLDSLNKLPGPSNSRIESFRLELYLDISSRFHSSLQTLKWFWPKLNRFFVSVKEKELIF
ncbi:hypothetical protein BX667DRAFT_422640 [Coemansia mojavensis]|nr:hypothetical protein BX667DRAFT_422640 [Coemansia mojavensis]